MPLSKGHVRLYGLDFDLWEVSTMTPKRKDSVKGILAREKKGRGKGKLPLSGRELWATRIRDFV